MGARFVLSYHFEQDSGPLWSANEAATTRYGPAVDPASLPLSLETREEIQRLAQWLATAAPGTAPECARFNEAALALHTLIESELGADYSIANDQKPLRAG